MNKKTKYFINTPCDAMPVSDRSPSIYLADSMSLARLALEGMRLVLEVC